MQMFKITENDTSNVCLTVPYIIVSRCFKTGKIKGRIT